MKKKYRLLKNYQFEELIVNGRSVFNHEFFIYYLKCNATSNVRIGISVPKKRFNKAFIRNKIKRQIKHMLADFDKDVPIDIVIIVKKKYLDNTFNVNKVSLFSLLNKVKLLMKEKKT